jgi:hypothetical protein
MRSLKTRNQMTAGVSRSVALATATRVRVLPKRDVGVGKRHLRGNELFGIRGSERAEPGRSRPNRYGPSKVALVVEGMRCGLIQRTAMARMR